MYEICLSSFIMSQVPVTLNSASIRSCSSWTWPWRQSRTESYLVNGAVIFISVLQRLYKSVPRPPPLRHLSGSQHAAGRPEALLWNHIPSSTEHGRCVTRRFSSMRELVCYLWGVFHHAGLQRAALAAFGQEIAHLQSRGQMALPAWSPLRWTESESVHSYLTSLSMQYSSRGAVQSNIWRQ